jgi:hypothetical protein
MKFDGTLQLNPEDAESMNAKMRSGLSSLE